MKKYLNTWQSIRIDAPCWYDERIKAYKKSGNIDVLQTLRSFIYCYNGIAVLETEKYSAIIVAELEDAFHKEVISEVKEGYLRRAMESYYRGVLYKEGYQDD